MDNNNQPNNNQNNNQNNQNQGGGNGPQKRQSLFMLMIAVLFTLMFMSFVMRFLSGGSNEISYSSFLNMVKCGQVESVLITDDQIKITPKKTKKEVSGNTLFGDYNQNPGQPESYYTGNLEDDNLYPLLDEYGVEYSKEIPDSSGMILSFILTWILPVVLLYIVLMFVFRKMSGSGGPMSVGRSNAKVYVQKETGVTFKDVAGQEEAKESLQEVVDFLHNPGKYTQIGAKLPKGALLVGPPGTGKTLLAKAVAGEAHVPFFSLAGSDFVELYVGVGASRVRDLFKEAQKNAPCIIFIDEIDAIGRSRDSKYGGGNEEREQTLNQLLSEMDDSVDLDAIALATSGAVGSDLANMINEAAINAVKEGRKAVCQKDLFDAVEVVLVGKEKKDRIMSKEERKIVSYHEVGHALISALQKNSEPVQKITIVPRTMGALGYVMHVPEEEKYLNTQAELHDMLVGLLGGRAAEELVFDTVTTGASNDIEKATNIARSMVTQYGMSKRFGLMGLETVESRYLDGRTAMNCSDVTAAAVDEEVMKILKDCYEEAVNLLKENREIMDKIAAHLIEKETITGKEFMAIYRREKGLPEEPEKEEGADKDGALEKEAEAKAEKDSVESAESSDRFMIPNRELIKTNAPEDTEQSEEE